MLLISTIALLSHHTLPLLLPVLHCLFSSHCTTSSTVTIRPVQVILDNLVFELVIGSMA